VGSLVSGREFGGVLFVVLVALDAHCASAVAGFAAIHSKAAGVVFFRAGGDVLTGHEITKAPSFLYGPAGVLLKYPGCFIKSPV
jgi:hypothetical protein